MSRCWRRIGAAVAVLALLEVIAVGVLVAVRSPTGPASSAYATGPRGFAAWATLLEDDGHLVDRRRVPFDVEVPDPDTTLVVIDATPSPEEVSALVAFVAAGGRLVAGGEGVEDWIDAVLGATPERGRRLAACRTLASVPETAGVQVVESSNLPGFGSFGAALPVIGCETAALVAVADVGRGRLVLVSDAAVLQEYLLGARDNATFARSVVGEVGRPVAFAEHLHGFTASSGLAALPGRVRWAAVLLVAAAGAALLARRATVPTTVAEPAPSGGSLPELDAVVVALSRSSATEQQDFVTAASERDRRRRSALGIAPIRPASPSPEPGGR